MSNNNELNRSYGSINSESNTTNISDNNSNGWLSKATNGVYNAGAGAVSYGVGGLKWALTSTATVGTAVLSAGAEGVVQLKKRASKDKNE
ncbi:unnamed protein product [Medioppia subpectinata]|uniref:Uncharacterized protein n=1 Tax=Medioppia subpectinata TaxID=1979941 RepID=A0A7R9QD35_9ACAR|nr:unnamed protein product [Medioppia subpectinata]CAG2118592.1 unnamed protein product [Medioppia subpectinata]